jgi:hypothetical protein
VRSGTTTRKAHPAAARSFYGWAVKKKLLGNPVLDILRRGPEGAEAAAALLHGRGG